MPSLQLKKARKLWGGSTVSSNASKTAKSFVWSFLEQGGSKAIQLIVQIILARILAPEAFGILAILLVVSQLMDSVAQSGLGTAIIQKKDANAVSYTTAWWLSLLIAVFLYVVVFFTAPMFEMFYGMDGLANYLRVLSLVVFFNAANSIQRSYLQRSMDFKSIFRASTIAVLLSGVIGIALAEFGWGVWALILQTLLQSFFLFIVMWFQISWRPSLNFSISQAKELFSYGWKICATGILGVFYQGVSELIIGRVCSASALGFFSQGRKYPNAAIAVLGNALQNVMFPALALVKDNHEKFIQVFVKFLKTGTFIVAPFSFLLTIVSEPIVALLLTEKWLPCVFVFQSTCLTCTVLILQIANLRAYMALGDSGLYLKLNIIKCGLGVVILSIIAVITRDINAIALAWMLFSVITVFVVDMVPAKRKFGYGFLRQLKDVAPTYGLCLIATIPTYMLSFFSLGYVPMLCLQVVVFCVIYLGAAILFRSDVLRQCVDMLKRRG